MDDREEEEGKKGEGDACNQSKTSFMSSGNTKVAATNKAE